MGWNGLEWAGRHVFMGLCKQIKCCPCLSGSHCLERGLQMHKIPEMLKEQDSLGGRLAEAGNSVRGLGPVGCLYEDI